MDFGDAIRALKAGRRVARRGWNGKGMWLALSPGNPALEAGKFWAGPNRDYAQANGGTAPVLPCFTMKTATGEILMGWLASQTDMLAEDWEPVLDINRDPLPGWTNAENGDAAPVPTLEEIISRAVAAMLRLAEKSKYPADPVGAVVAGVRHVIRDKAIQLNMPDDAGLRQMCNDALMRALMAE